MAKSREFVWVYVDRDLTPEIPKRFQVSAYPSMLVLGPKEENVHRFKSFQPPDEFLGNLSEGLERWQLFLEGEDWSIPTPRPEQLVDGCGLESHPLEEAGVPSGITADPKHKDRVWVAQARELRLYELKRRSTRIRKSLQLERAPADLCTNGKDRLFVLPSGWTKGDPIEVRSARDGRLQARLVTEANQANRHSGAKGIAWKDEHLWVLEGMRGHLRKLDPESGAVLDTLKLEGSWLSGLDFNGESFVSVGREAIQWFDPDSGALIHELAVHYPLRSIAHDTRAGVLRVLEQPVFGFDRAHQRIQVWPTRTEVHTFDPSDVLSRRRGESEDRSAEHGQ